MFYKYCCFYDFGFATNSRLHLYCYEWLWMYPYMNNKPFLKEKLINCWSLQANKDSSNVSVSVFTELEYNHSTPHPIHTWACCTQAHGGSMKPQQTHTCRISRQLLNKEACISRRLCPDELQVNLCVGCVLCNEREREREGWSRTANWGQRNYPLGFL